jgi:membrane protein
VTSDPASTSSDAVRPGRRFGDRIQDSVLGDLLRELARTRVLDLAYTLAAMVFVAVMPIILVITSAFTASGQDSLLARELIDRFGLVGAARVSVNQLFTTPGAGTGVYWTGLVIALYTAFSLSRRVLRAYSMIWDLPVPAANQQWRGLVWVLVQVVLVLVASTLRSVGRSHGTAAEIVVLVVVLAVWGASDYVTQWLMTLGRVARDRLLVAAALVTLGRLGVTLWSGLYLPGLLSRQSEHFGPIGVVFSLFSWIFATMFVLLFAALLAAVLTGRPVATWLRRPAHETAA